MSAGLLVSIDSDPCPECGHKPESVSSCVEHPGSVLYPCEHEVVVDFEELGPNSYRVHYEKLPEHMRLMPFLSVDLLS